jgi:hypothetical protein
MIIRSSAIWISKELRQPRTIGRLINLIQLDVNISTQKKKMISKCTKLVLFPLRDRDYNAKEHGKDQIMKLPITYRKYAKTE